jgi:hypothetical protein
MSATLTLTRRKRAVDHRVQRSWVGVLVQRGHERIAGDFGELCGDAALSHR